MKVLFDKSFANKIRVKENDISANICAFAFAFFHFLVFGVIKLPTDHIEEKPGAKFFLRSVVLHYNYEILPSFCVYVPWYN